MTKSGFQRFCEKIKEFFVSKEDATNFLTNDDIDIEDVVLKSKDVYGTSNLGSSGQCIAGLVPVGHQTMSPGKYLKVDGTWENPHRCYYGTATISSGYSTAIAFGRLPSIVKVWDSDGKLVNISIANGTSKPDKIFGSGTFSAGGTTNTWTFNANTGSYVYEVIVEDY